MKNTYKLAKIRSRIIAIFLDEILSLIGITNLILLMGIYLIDKFENTYQFLLILIAFSLVVLIIIDTLIYLVIPKILKGQTLGKSIVGIRLVKDGYSNLRVKDYVVRYLTMSTLHYFTSFFGYFIQYYVIRKSDLRKSVHDKFAHTIVINTDNDKRKKLITSVIYIILFLILTVTSLFLITKLDASLKSNNFKERIQISEEESAVALLGDNGPLSTATDEYTEFEGKEHLLRAEGYYIQSDIEKAKSEIDEAYSINSNSLSINAYRCFIHQEYGNYELATQTCIGAYEKFPNSPSIVGNLIISFYMVDRCSEVDTLAKHLSSIRMLPYYDKQTKSSYYGNAGVVLYFCNLEKELGNILLNEAINLTDIKTEKDTYKSYLRK